MSELAIRELGTRVTKRKKPSNVSLKGWWDSQKFGKKWHERNSHVGQMCIESLEVEYVPFHFDFFVEESKEFITRLHRIGFEQLNTYPTSDKYSFITMYYNSKHNVAIGLYKPTLKNAIYKASQIVKEAQVTGETAEAVFVACVNNM